MSHKKYSVCVIGNSHVAALKQAWTNRAPAVSTEFSVTFFSAQNRLMTCLERKGRALVPTDDELAQKLEFTSEGKRSIEVDDYDAFVFVGSGFCVDLLKFWTESGSTDGLRHGAVQNLVSRACFEAVVEAVLTKSLLADLVREISAITSAPVIVASAPFPSERILDDDAFKDDARFRDPAFLAPLVACSTRAAERVAKRLNTEIIWQEESTIGLPGFTASAFGANPVRFAMRGNTPPPVDRRHGNEDYGFLMLMAVLRRFDELSSGRVLADAPAQTEAGTA